MYVHVPYTCMVSLEVRGVCQISGGFELPMWVLEIETNPLEKKPVLLNTESSVQSQGSPPLFFFKFCLHSFTYVCAYVWMSKESVLGTGSFPLPCSFQKIELKS